MAITESAQQIFHMIEHAAECGDECPSNSLLAEAVGRSSMAGGTEMLNQLVREGLVTVQRGNKNRVVTIVATGKRTAGIITKPHWRERPENAWRKNIKIGQNPKPVKVKKGEGPNTVRVDRDPCPRCGTRGDIGCSHSGARLLTR